MAAPCHFLLKKKDVVHSYQFYKTRLSLFRSKFSSKAEKFHIFSLLRSGIENNLIDERTIQYLSKKLKKLKNTTDEDFEYFDDIYNSVKNRSPELEQRLIQKNKTIAKFNISDDLREHFKTRKHFINKIKNSDLILLQKVVNKYQLPISSTDDIDLLIDLFFLADHRSSTSKFSIISSIHQIFLKIQSESKNIKLTRVQKKIFNQYKKLNVDKNNFYYSLRRWGLPEDRARSHVNTYKSQKLMCKARTLKPAKYKSSLSNYKWLVYAMGFSSVMGGYLYSELGVKNVDDAFSRESFKKFTLELVITMLATAIGTKIVTTEKMSNTEKVIVQYLYSTIVNGVDAKAYDIGFVDKVSTDIQNPDTLKEIVNNLSKSYEISILFKRINNSKTPEKEISKILVEYNYDKNAEITDEFIDTFQQIISLQVNYNEKYSNNFHIKTGNEALDRFYYNSAYGVFATFKSIGIGVFSYNLFCQGNILGPYFIGGANQLKTAVAFSITLMLLDKVLSTGLYYWGRKKVINQGF